MYYHCHTTERRESGAEWTKTHQYQEITCSQSIMKVKS